MAGPQFVALKTKPTARLCYRFYPTASPLKPVLTVFLNGPILPQVSWTRVINKIKELRREDKMPAMLTYDRYGQGQTEDRDPLDEMASDPAHGHDCSAAVKDLHQLIDQITTENMDMPVLGGVSLVLVGNAIGGAIARLYAQEYPGTVAGLLILDLTLTNSDIVSLFPNPKEAGFDADVLPEGITVEDLHNARAGMRKIFHPDVASQEGLSRKNLATLLPDSDGPILKGPDGEGPYVTVIGHDPETFTEDAERLMGRSGRINMEYLSPQWHLYNQGLVKITQKDRAEGPLIAPNSGNIIQKDNPEFVAQELDDLLSKIM